MSQKASVQMQYGHSFEVWKYDGTLCRMVLNIMSLEGFSVMAHLKGKKQMFEHDPKSF